MTEPTAREHRTSASERGADRARRRGDAALEIGTQLPSLRIEATPTFIVSTALATRDFQDVHHDRDRAVALGSKDIFINILTDTGLVQRFVTDWAGPAAVVRSVAIRLGVPCYAYETLTFTGTVTAVEGDEVTVEVVGANSLGNHVTGTVIVRLEGASQRGTSEERTGPNQRDKVRLEGASQRGTSEERTGPNQRDEVGL